MAQQPRQPSADAAPFVRDIVSDPKNVPDVMLLYGYLGASSEEGHDRLYLSPDLTNYVEVPNDAVLHRMAAPKEQDPHGGVTLWVKKDAALIYKMSPAAEALAHYFAGAVQAAAGQAAGAAAVQPTPPLTLFGPACGVTAACTLNTCGIACTVVGPCLTMGCTQQRTPCPQATCGIDCSVVGPCLSQHMTCMHFCTHVTPCHPTRGQPQCPFPTEVTCAPVCHASPAPFCGPQVTVGAACGVPGGQPGQAAMAARCVGVTAVGTVPIACTPACSIFCPTQQGWVCWSHRTPCCPVPTLVGITCAFICQSQQSLCCPVSGGAFCPPVTGLCPGSLAACGPGQPGPVDQAALGMAHGLMAPPSEGCTFMVVGGCGRSLQCTAWCDTVFCTWPPHGCRG
jgi:hypothetical protein